MKERTRVVGIIIQDHSMLLVKGSDRFQEYWTPGGKLESGESDLECLSRELDEELNVKLISADYFGEYREKSQYYEDTLSISKVYIVQVSGNMKPGNEIQGYVWMTKKEFIEEKYPLVNGTRQRIIPDLVKADYF